MTTYSIVGTSFRKNDFDLTKIEVGTAVTLVREPSNGYDPNAIMVWIGGHHVGYIPKKQNAALAQFIDQTGRLRTQTIAVAPPGAILDSAVEISHEIDAKFARSPNSGYPQVVVE